MNLTYAEKVASLEHPGPAAEQLKSDPTIELLRELIRRPSVTPDDAGCQEMLIARLERAGFTCESMLFSGVTNLWARRGREHPVFCFAGHTDVVPPHILYRTLMSFYLNRKVP